MASAQKPASSLVLTGANFGADCKVSISGIATLGSEKDSVLLSADGMPVRDNRGRYLAPAFGGPALLFFDSTGRFQTVLGKRGSGPANSRRQSLTFLSGGVILYLVRHGFGAPRSPIYLVLSCVAIFRSISPPPAPFFDLLPLPNGLFVYSAAHHPDSRGRRYFRC